MALPLTVFGAEGAAPATSPSGARDSASRSAPEALVRPRPWEVSLGTMILLGFPGPGSAFGPTLQVSRALSRHTALALFIAGPLSNREHHLPNGDSWTARQELAALELSVRLALSRHALLALAAGGGVYHVDLRARSVIGPVQHRGSFSGLASASARFDFKLRADIALYADVRAVAVTPVPVLQFTGRRIATAGDPALGVSLGIAIAF